MKFAACALALLGTLTCGPIAEAQNWPTRPVKIVVPYQAGQGTDVAARYFAEQLSKALGQNFIVDNKPGAGGNIGSEAAAHAPADGYTLLMGTNATQTMNEFLYPSLGFRPDKDFAPILLVARLPMVISANPGFSGNSVAELIAAAQAQPDKIDVALPSNTARLVFELFKQRSGAKLFAVLYKGSASAITEVTGGQVQALIDTVTATRGHVSSGKLKALGITTAAESALMPGVKPVAAQGLPGFEMTAWNAFYAPIGTRGPVISRLANELTKILAQPETREKLALLGLEPVTDGSPAGLAELERQERLKWEPLIKAAGLKGE
jgi:tripartite-type tricarboxylate transporter receptor subunit TctC